MLTLTCAGADNGVVYKLYRQGSGAYATWAYTAAGAVTGGMVVQPGTNRIFFGTASPSVSVNGSLSTYSVYGLTNGGNLLWRWQSPTVGPFNSSGVYSAATGLVYFAAGDGTLLAMEPATGNTNFTGFSTKIPGGGGFVGSPAVDPTGHYLYVASTDGFLYAFSARLPSFTPTATASPTASKSTGARDSATPTSSSAPTPSRSSSVLPTPTSTQSVGAVVGGGGGGNGDQVAIIAGASVGGAAALVLAAVGGFFLARRYGMGGSTVINWGNSAKATGVSAASSSADAAGSASSTPATSPANAASSPSLSRASSLGKAAFAPQGVGVPSSPSRRSLNVAAPAPDVTVVNPAAAATAAAADAANAAGSGPTV